MQLRLLRRHKQTLAACGSSELLRSEECAFSLLALPLGEGEFFCFGSLLFLLPPPMRM